jgi:hypothetical protein
VALQKSEVVRLNLIVIADRVLGLILEEHAPGLTICSECDEMEFAHKGDCTLAIEVELRAADIEANEIGSKLGPLITFQ